MSHRMLVAGVGNIFLGDDGFGPEVARRLAELDLPAQVRVTDYGIRGMHLAYDLAEGYGTTILVDAAARGGEPGTLYVIEPDLGERPGASAPGAFFDAHGMQPDVVFGLLGMLGGEPGRVLVVGCEPASLEHGIGLSAPVAAAVDEAVRVVTGLICADAAAAAATGALTSAPTSTASADASYAPDPPPARGASRAGGQPDEPRGGVTCA
jgi:hydrogenase maturation protease